MRVAWLLLGLCLVQEKVEKGTSPARALRPSSDASLQEFLRRYEVPDKEFEWELREIRSAEKFIQSWLTFRSPVKTDVESNNTVWAKVWQPRDDKAKRPAAVVLHWLAGDFKVLELVCQKMAENGIVALMMYMPHYGPRRSPDREQRTKLVSEDMAGTLANMRQAVLDVRRAGDWLASRPDVDPERVGIVGISLGSIIGSLSAGIDDRFTRSVLIIGGGDLPAIVLHGSKETAEQKKKLEEAGYTVDKLRELWKEIEPCTFAPRVRAAGVLMINAEDDEIIPKAATLRLHEAMGKPELKWFKGGHYAVAFQTGAIIRDISAHFNREPGP